MAKFVNYKRIVIYQPRNAWVVDLGPGRCKAPTYNMGDEYFNTGAGTRKAIARQRDMIIQVFDETHVDTLRIMHKEGCEMRCIAVGDETAIVWEMDSEINFIENNDGIGGFSGGNLIFFNAVKWGSIYQSKNILAGIPWACETATDDGGTFYLPGPDGWTGNRWQGASGDSVDEDGLATITGSDLRLEMYFPMQGATINLTNAWAGSVDYLDFSGATISTTTKSTKLLDSSETIPDETWKILVKVTSADSEPTIHVTNPGSMEDPRRGGCIDCSDLIATLSTAPDWSS